MNVDKEIFELWKELNPVDAFCSGLKEFAGRMWIPTDKNVNTALKKINALLAKPLDDTARKFLTSMKTDLLFDELPGPPSEVLGTLYNYMLVEGINEKHMKSLLQGCLELLDAEKYLLKKTWPSELRVMTVQECDGAIDILKEINKNIKNAQTKALIKKLESQLLVWKKHCKITLKKGDFSEVFPLLEKSQALPLQRKKLYPAILKDIYDYVESAEEIESKALSWLHEELPVFKQLAKEIAHRENCRQDIESIDKALQKKFSVKKENLLTTIKKFRKLLQRIAEKEWVKITPKYDVRIIETPNYLVPFIPTAAMNSFASLTKNPFCVFFATTDAKGSPSNCLPDLLQTVIHEEYGHCVNFENSFTNFVEKLRIIEVLESALSTPTTEGISFHRELESLNYFKSLESKEKPSKTEKEFIEEIKKLGSFDDFVFAFAFCVYKWRILRFLRAVSDSRINTGKQSFVDFINWAHQTTGISKKLIYDQTFFFQENPGYAPCYSIFGMRLKDIQKKALEKGVSRLDFNTFVISVGFPARTIVEKKLLNNFRL